MKAVRELMDEAEGVAEGEAPAADVEDSGALMDETRSESAPDKQVQLLSPDQQAVMHRISEAIAMLIYNQEANGPIMDMAMQGPEGVVRAVGMVLDRVMRAAKPGIPRDLLPMAAIAALMLINDFLERAGEQPVDMREVLPLMIDHLGRQFNANPMEMAQMRRIKSKFNRAEERKSVMQGVDEDAPAQDAPPEEGAEEIEQ